MSDKVWITKEHYEELRAERDALQKKLTESDLLNDKNVEYYENKIAELKVDAINASIDRKQCLSVNEILRAVVGDDFITAQAQRAVNSITELQKRCE